MNFGLSYDQKNLTKTDSYYQMTNTGLGLIKNLIFVELRYNFNAGREVKKKQQSDKTNQESQSSKKSSLF